MLQTLPFREIWAVDFEFSAPPGERPDPHCLVGWELRSGRKLRRDQFGPTPPYPLDSDSLFIAYYASAELGCHRALGWPMPVRILDLFTEFRDQTNGLETPAGNSLLGALAYFGLDAMSVVEKKEMRDLAIRGGPFTSEERVALLDYCEEDVAGLAHLLPVMLPRIDLPRALLRGRYMAAASAMEHNGVPIDLPTLELLRQHWLGMQDDLIAAVDQDCGVFDGRTFKANRFEALLVRLGIPWPRLESGRLDLQDDTFRQIAKSYPIISPLRELRSSLASLRLNDLAVGRDARNRRLLSAFGSSTGRNQPSSTAYIFGPSVWIRGLIKPPPGHGVAYIDYGAQEVGIAAALSGDAVMQADYQSGDPYLAFGKQIGAVPDDATKETHEAQRQLYKQCILGTQYGMGEQTLALRIGRSVLEARDLLHAHRRTYRKFEDWSEAVLNTAMLRGEFYTVFGWHIHVTDRTNPRTLRNFPMQANGAEMLRLACCLATERGIEVSGPIHDAVLICAPLDRLEEDVARMQAAMAEASRIVLNGFEIRTDAKLVRHPDRYMDPRGRVMWDRVTQLVAKRQVSTSTRTAA
jgi:DNA polymerase-1